jgi:hypothetical protein
MRIKRWILLSAFGMVVGCSTEAPPGEDDKNVRDSSRYDDDGKDDGDDDNRSSLETPQEVACEHECATGDKRCGDADGPGASTQVCAEVDGCRRFTQGPDCAGDTSCDRSKNDGSCKAGCANDPGCHELTVGLEQCAPATGARSRVMCKREGSCFEWLATTACSPDERCSGGRCVASCTNACSSGASRCVSGDAKSMERCSVGTNGCTSWAKIACAASHFCTGGTCGPL